MNEKMSKTSEDIRRMPTSSRSPSTKKSPFVTRESSAFATLTEVCGGVNKYEWPDHSEEDKTNALKMDIPPFDVRNVEKNAEKIGRYLVLTGKAKAKDRVKANLIVQGIKDPELQERVSKLLQTATSFEDFLKASKTSILRLRRTSQFWVRFRRCPIYLMTRNRSKWSNCQKHWKGCLTS